MNNPTKNRSSRNSRSSRSLLAALLFAVAALFVLAPALATAAPVRTALDRKVDAIPAQALLTEDPRSLVDVYRQHAANHVIVSRETIFLLSSLAQILTFLILWQTGTAARIRDWIRRATRNVTVLRFSYVVVIGGIATLAALPFSYAGFRVAHDAGLAAQRTSGWFIDYLTVAILNIAGAALVITIVLALVDRTRLWYLWTAGILVVGSIVISLITPLAIAPLFTPVKPMPLGYLHGQIESVLRASGVGKEPIVIGKVSRKSTAPTAYVEGLGPSARVVVGDTLLVKATPGEVVFAVARQLGHAFAKDALRLALVGAGLFILATALAVFVSDRIGFRRDDDPLSRLSLLAVFLGIFILALLPVYNAYARGREVAADRYALRLTNDPASAIRSVVRYAEDGLVPVCPRKSIRWVFLTYPPLASRIAEIQGRDNPCP